MVLAVRPAKSRQLVLVQAIHGLVKKGRRVTHRKIFSPYVTQMWLVRLGGRGEPSTGSTSSHVAFVLTSKGPCEVNIRLSVQA